MRRNSEHRDDKSKKRRRSRSSSGSSRSSTSSGEREGARKRLSDAGPEAAAVDGALQSALVTGTTAATGSVAEPDVIEAPKIKRRLSFYDDAQCSAPDATAPQRQQDSSTEYAMCKLDTPPSTEARFPEERGATDGQPARDQTTADDDAPLLRVERKPSQPTRKPENAASQAGTAPASSMISKKETVDASLTPEKSMAVLPQESVKMRTRRGSAVTLSIPSAGVPRRSVSGKSSSQDSGSQREPSFSSFVRGLKSISAERHEEEQNRLRGSKPLMWGFDHGQLCSRIVVTVAGVPLKVKHVLLMAILTLIVTSVTVVVFHFTRQEPVPAKPYCKTKGCFVHAWRLSDKLNTSLDPCQDFSAYVCSAWSPPGGYLEHSNSAMDDVRKSWFPVFEEMLREGSKSLRVGHKPLLMYTTCMGDSKRYGSHVDIFWKFLNESGLSWPEDRYSSGTSALDVLMTLAFKWQVPLFFQLRVQRLAWMSNWRLTLEPGSLIPLVYQHHVTVKSTGGYAKYWESFFYILRESSNGSAINRTRIDEAIALEGDVFRRLLVAMHPSVVRPVLVPVAKIGLYTRPLESTQWLRALRRLELQPEVKTSDKVLIGDEKFFETMAVVMSTYKNSQLLSLIAWSCVQLLAPAVDVRLLRSRYDHGVVLYRPYFCERFVETGYRLLVIALSTVSRFSEKERAAVSAKFDRLVTVATSLVSATEWLDVEGRQLAAEKLSSTRLQLWPPDFFLKSDELERLYADFPDAELPFAEHWIQLIVRAQTIDILGYAVNYALPYLRYDAASGSVKVAVGAVSPPLYYSDGNNAMFYGGLGFSMALQLVASVDRQGLRWHPNGTYGDSFLPNADDRAFEDKDGCLAAVVDDPVDGPHSHQARTDGWNSVFPEIPALEVAYAAYRESIGNGEDDRSQGISRNFSGDQVFFMTLCYMTCSLPGAVGPHMVDCNKAVSNSEAFARVFNCARGSKMNPKKKCTFFTR
ncbi:hypothetical protein HPB50_015247 [Hyalomma asiaticum]|uniref:Uncharacterized protein n=1 Tax=Hyalomma asiaticum TaxID=266040 RepID=A0ACB7SHR9_HYAAI|nr:hypothetical protein HPB50_015247 [Hyalomma asiaticum]